MAPFENTLLQLVKKQVIAQFGEAWFLRQWAWPNPDAGHLRLKLPNHRGYGYGPRKRLDLRIRPASDCLVASSMPGHLRQGVSCIGCWPFDGSEQVAMTDFWILVLEGTVHQPPTYVVLPTQILLGFLRSSANTGRLYLYFTLAGECYASPSLQTKLSALRLACGPNSFCSSVCLTRYLNAWHLLTES